MHYITQTLKMGPLLVLCSLLSLGSHLFTSHAHAAGPNWQAAKKACLPERDRMAPSFNWTTGAALSGKQMPDCHCPPKHFCPDNLSEWSDHPRMPAAQAAVCCPAPRICDVNITETGCDLVDSTTQTLNSFCHSFEAKLIPLLSKPNGVESKDAKKQRETQNADREKENKIRQAGATTINTCMKQCKTIAGQIRAGDANSPANLSLFNQLATCESSCRVAAASSLGYSTVNSPFNSSINGDPVQFTVTDIIGNSPIPDDARTLLEDKLSCNNQETVGFCSSTVGFSCMTGDGDGDGGGGGDCLALGSQVLMADGTHKPIEDIKTGDQVKGYGSINTVTATTRNFTITETIYSVNDGVLQITDGHPVLTKDGWKAINPALVTGKLKENLTKLEPGDLLLRHEGEPLEITSLTPLQSGTTTDRHNLAVDGDNSFIANGIVLRGFNLKMQY